MLKTQTVMLLLKKELFKIIIQNKYIFNHASTVSQTVHANKILWGRQQTMYKHKRELKGKKVAIVVRELSTQKLIVKKYM